MANNLLFWRYVASFRGQKLDLPEGQGCLRVIVTKDNKHEWHEFPLEHCEVVAIPGHEVSEEVTITAIPE